MLKEALKYSKWGWSLIPIRKDGSKAPAIESWKEFQTRRPTEAELRKWFEAGQNDMAVVTGKISGLTVIDCDSEAGLKAVIEKGAKTNVKAKSPQGFHLYFKYTPNIRTSVRLLPDVDTRNDGGYCLLSPSTGYLFTNPYFRGDSLPELTSSFLFESKAPSENPRTKGRVSELLDGLKEGNRDDTFTKVIGLLHSDRYAPSDILAFLSAYAESSGFGILELEKKIKYLTERYPNNNGKPEIKEPGSLSIGNFLEHEEKVEWLCKPFFSKPSLGFLVGLPESLKSWLAIDLAIELARGGKWCGKFQCQKSKVLYIDQERARPETQRRFKGLLSEKCLKKSDLNGQLFVDVSSHRKIDLDASYESFKHEVSQIRPDVIIIDSFVTFHNKPEQDRMEIQKVLDRIKQIREQFNCSTVFVNHEGKQAYQDAVDNQPPSAGRMVGSIGIVAAAESVLSVKKLPGNHACIYQTKNSLANPQDSFVIEVVDTNKGIKVSTDEIVR